MSLFLNPVLEPETWAGIRYEYDAGPDKVRDLDDARIHGVNCGAFVHIAIRELFGFSIPSHLMCLELFHDFEEKYFYCIDLEQDAQIGDIYFMGRVNDLERIYAFAPRFNPDQTFANIDEHPPLHLVMIRRSAWHSLEHEVIHADYRTGGIVVTTLGELMKEQRYAQVYGIRRLMHEHVKLIPRP